MGPEQTSEEIGNFAENMFMDLFGDIILEAQSNSDFEFSEFYYFDTDLQEMIWVPYKEAKRYLEVNNSFNTGCSCWTLDESAHELDAHELHADALFSRTNPDYELLFKLMLKANGVGHISNTPRLGAAWEMQHLRPFSDAWYGASFSTMLYKFEDSSIYQALNNAFFLGIAFSEQKWKSRHFDNSVVGAKNQLARNAAEVAKPIQSAKRKRELHDCVARLWKVAEAEKGAQRMRKDFNAALEIHALAEVQRPKELLIKSTGKLKSPETIRKLIPELRRLGKLE